MHGQWTRSKSRGFKAEPEILMYIYLLGTDYGLTTIYARTVDV